MKKETKPIIWDGVNSISELFNEQFTISDFCTLLEKSEMDSLDTIASARIAIKKVFEKQENEPKLVVNISDDVKQAMENGEVRLDTGANGEVYAQLRYANGRYGGKLSVKEELQEEGISAEDLQLAMQMDMIREQLKVLIDGVREVENKVTAVIQGQRNDRIGLFYSGLSLYLESKVIQDEYLKKQLLSQAIKAISDANYQIIQDIRIAMEYLMTEQYKSTPKMMMKNINEKLNVIHQCYDVVFRAAFLKAAIYHENRELSAMIMALDEYSKFVEKLILPYIGKLSELDSDSHFIEKSVWGNMARSLNGCNEIKQKLAMDGVYYLSLGGVANVKG